MPIIADYFGASYYAPRWGLLPFDWTLDRIGDNREPFDRVVVENGGAGGELRFEFLNYQYRELAVTRNNTLCDPRIYNEIQYKPPTEIDAALEFTFGGVKLTITSSTIQMTLNYGAVTSFASIFPVPDLNGFCNIRVIAYFNPLETYDVTCDVFNASTSVYTNAINLNVPNLFRGVCRIRAIWNLILAVGQFHETLVVASFNSYQYDPVSPYSNEVIVTIGSMATIPLVSGIMGDTRFFLMTNAATNPLPAVFAPRNSTPDLRITANPIAGTANIYYSGDGFPDGGVPYELEAVIDFGYDRAAPHARIQDHLDYIAALRGVVKVCTGLRYVLGGDQYLLRIQPDSSGNYTQGGAVIRHEVAGKPWISRLVIQLNVVTPDWELGIFKKGTII